MDSSPKWVRRNMSLYHVDVNCAHKLSLLNSGNLAADFRKYATDFFDAAEVIIHYLVEEAAKNHDIEKLDLWYFALIYLYRQSLELLLKANIFRITNSKVDRQDVVRRIRHDLSEGFQELLKLMQYEDEHNNNTTWLSAYFSDITLVDRESDMFRYPFGNNMSVLFEKQTHISLLATHANMNKAYDILMDVYTTGAFSETKYEADLPRLIIEGGHYYQRSVVGYKYDRHSFDPYLSSYVEVGDYLKKIMISQKREELFLPMCYMYRNSIELGLKKIIVEDSHMESSKALRILQRKKHSILVLWNSIVEEIKLYANAPDDDTTLEDALQYIQAFHNFDQSSDLFRYPCNKNMEIYFLGIGDDIAGMKLHEIWFQYEASLAGA